MKTFSNLYSAIKHGRNIILRPKWGTELDNTLQAWFDGCLPTPNKIIYYNDVHNLYNQGLSVREIANILPIHISSVRRILKGKGLIKYKDKFCYVNKQQK